MNFTLAMIQMRVEGGQKQRNLQHARELIRRAAADGAQVVLLPEAMPLGWTHSSARKGADAIPDGESCAMLREAGAPGLEGLTDLGPEPDTGTLWQRALQRGIRMM